MKSPDISLENSAALPKDNKEKIGEKMKAANENHTHLNDVKSKGIISMPDSIEKLKIHNAPRQDEKEEKEDICHLCKEKLDDDWKEPHWKWNLDKNSKLCVRCYKIKETKYEKLMNYCSVCNTKLKFIRYNPKPKWKISGQLCRRCWDFKNSEYKSDKQ